MVQSIINCPVHLGTLYVWHEHAWNWLGCLTWGNDTSGSGSCSEHESSSWLLGTIASGRVTWLFPWAELLVALGIMDLWTNNYRTCPISTKNCFPEAIYTQARNFCTKHCRDYLIFTWAESKAVLASLGIWIWDYRTPPGSNLKQYLLYKLFKALSIKSLCLIYMQFSKSSKSSTTPSTLASSAQVTSRVKQTVLA